MAQLADEQFDIIFAGGGTAACVVAGRLAAADPSLRILVLEAGKHTRDQDAHIQPFRFISHLAPTSTTVTFNISNPSKHLRGRAAIVPSGRCVGGGSSVNFAAYTRASPSDYDDWETIYRNPGWGSKDLIPLFKKTETYQVLPDQVNHGYSGPLKVSRGGIQSNVGKEFLEVAKQYDPEREVGGDVADLIKCNVYGPCAKWIDGESGRRSDAAHHFIYNQRENINLQVLDGKRVKRVVIENGRAVGVEYVIDTLSCPGTEQSLSFARASRLVVVSAGAFGSPGILERSGIGASAILKQHGVEEIVDLPGVGENYQDHNVSFVPYLASDQAETLDPLFRGDQEALATSFQQWAKDGKGPVAQNGVDAALRLRPNSDELNELGPSFQDRWQTFFANKPDKAIAAVAPIAAFLGDFSAAPPRNYLSACYFTFYPASTGSVHIKSGNDANAAPDFTAGFLSDPSDLAPLRLGYKKTRELLRRMPVYRGEYIPSHPPFTDGSAAKCGEACGPVAISAPDITYSPEDDEVIDNFHRDVVQTAWHSLGTCAMKPREEGGVVDHYLNVYGVEGLKVADLSIAPSNVGANTYSTALVVGEKAAVIIAKELGIKGVV